jgi:hypothetical protein
VASLLIAQARPGDAVSRITTIEEGDAGGLTAARISSTMMTSEVARKKICILYNTEKTNSSQKEWLPGPDRSTPQQSPEFV